MRNCSNCRFWLKAQVEDAEVGVCRRYPPTLYGLPPYSRADFPLTAGTTWCGDWRPFADAVPLPGSDESDTPAASRAPLKQARPH
jgi:hypothetical protein